MLIRPQHYFVVDPAMKLMEYEIDMMHTVFLRVQIIRKKPFIVQILVLSPIRVRNKENTRTVHVIPDWQL